KSSRPSWTSGNSRSGGAGRDVRGFADGPRLPLCADAAPAIAGVPSRAPRRRAREGFPMCGGLRPWIVFLALLIVTQWTAAQDARAADADAGLTYRVLDLDLGKSVCLGDSVGVRLFGGARFASIDESLKCVYSGGALGTGFDSVSSPVDFRGAGLTAGAEG